HGEQPLGIIHFQEMIDVKPVHGSCRDIGGRVWKGQVPSGGFPPRIPVMQERGPEETADGVGNLLSGSHRLHDQSQLMGGLRLRFQTAHHSVLPVAMDVELVVAQIAEVVRYPFLYRGDDLVDLTDHYGIPHTGDADGAKANPTRSFQLEEVLLCGNKPGSPHLDLTAG